MNKILLFAHAVNGAKCALSFMGSRILFQATQDRYGNISTLAISCLTVFAVRAVLDRVNPDSRNRGRTHSGAIIPNTLEEILNGTLIAIPVSICPDIRGVIFSLGMTLLNMHPSQLKDGRMRALMPLRALGLHLIDHYCGGKMNILYSTLFNVAREMQDVGLPIGRKGLQWRDRVENEIEEPHVLTPLSAMRVICISKLTSVANRVCSWFTGCRKRKAE